jgi:uncharacterized membrane protein
MSKSLTITAFIISLGFMLPYVSPIFSLAGLILGIIALIKSKGDSKLLKTLAIVAIVIGVIGLIVFALGFLRAIFGVAAANINK